MARSTALEATEAVKAEHLALGEEHLVVAEVVADHLEAVDHL